MAATLCLAPLVAPVAASSADDTPYAVTYLRAPGSADVGETITVKVDATNTGDTLGSGTIDYRVDLDGDGTLEPGETLASKDVFLSPNKPETITFTVTLDGVEPGERIHGAVSNADSVTERITVTEASNGAPNPDAGADTTVTAGETVTLDGSGSSDPDGDSLSYSWTQTAGPSVSLSGAGTATPTFTAPDVDTSTTLGFDLTVDDGDATATDGVEVTVEPEDSSGSSGAAKRTLSAPTVRAGGTIDVTLTMSFDEAKDRIAVEDNFTGPVASASLVDVRVNGESATNKVLLPGVSKDGVLVALQNIGSDATVEVVYEVEVDSAASDGDTVRFTGADGSDVVAGSFEAEFGVDEAVVGTPVDVERTLESTEVAPGGSVQVSIEGTFDTAYPTMSIQDRFEGPTAGAQVVAIRLNGQDMDLSKVVFARPIGSGVSFALAEIPSGATVEVVYSVAVQESASSGDTITFTGTDGAEVTGPNLDGELGAAVATVVEAVGPVEQFDADGNGDISTEELHAAIQAWANGSVSTDSLNLVIQAWATSG